MARSYLDFDSQQSRSGIISLNAAVLRISLKTPIWDRLYHDLVEEHYFDLEDTIGFAALGDIRLWVD